MAEKEYIERKALGIGRCNPEVFENKAYADGWNSAIEIIESTPTANVAEVVRCKDCKYYDKKYHQCKLHSEEPDQYYTGFIFCMQEDDFCSYGERKE